jgi:hypothetical protein
MIQVALSPQHQWAGQENNHMTQLQPPLNGSKRVGVGKKPKEQAWETEPLQFFFRHTA